MRNDASPSIVESTKRPDAAVMDTNHNIYDKRLKLHQDYPRFSYQPRCIYFYYIRVGNERKVSVDHYFYCSGSIEDPESCPPIPLTDVASIAQKLAINASTGGNNPSPDVSRDFQNIIWRHRSYIIFVVDEPGWEFYTREAQRTPAITFNVQKGSTANHSFYDATDIVVSLPNLDDPDKLEPRSGIFFVNHMTANEDGRILGEYPTGDVEESEGYIFDMYLKAHFRDPDAIPMTVIFDPGSENQGPPLNP